MYQKIRRMIVIIIALVMAVPMIAGTSEVSYAASVSGAKAANYGFKMVRISWKAVLVELPQKPIASKGSVDPAEPEVAQESVNASSLVNPSDSMSHDADSKEEDSIFLGESSAPTDDLEAQSGSKNNEPSALAADLPANPEVQSSSESNETAVLAPDQVETSEVQSSGSNESSTPVADPVEETGEMTIQSDGDDQPAEDSASDPAATPVVTMDTEADAEPEAEPVYDVITYKVYRATAKKGKYKLIKTTKATSFINKGLTIGKRYYYKVVAYTSSGKKYGTSTVVSVKVAKQVTANMTLLKVGNAAFNFRIAAKQKLYQYDTLQGACANGGYAYLTLYNRKVEKCKIVKVKLSTRSVIKVSAALPVYHANNLTYNTKKKRIVATCCTTSKKAKNRVVFISPKTLKVTAVKNIKLTKKVKKLPKKVRKKNKGFTAVAYNEKHNCYVARLRQDNNIVILNKDLKPLRYVKLKGKKTGLLAQGIETTGNYIYDVRSFKGRYRYCMVTVHTMSGKYVGQMRFPYGMAPGKELQCIFHDGGQFYAGFYYSTSQMNDTKKNHVNRVNLIQKLNNL